MTSRTKASSSTRGTDAIEDVGQPPLLVTNRKRPKTNSERGRTFRERKAQHLQTLETAVQELRHTIHEKTFLRGVWEAKILRSRHSKLGSVALLVREYYAYLQHGLKPESSDSQSLRSVPSTGRSVSQIEDFLLRLAHPDIWVGDMQGAEHLASQWRAYTTSHAFYEGQVCDVNVYGTDHDPIAHVKLLIHVQLSRATFDIMFPEALADDTLVQALIGKQVVYSASSLIFFTHDNRVISQVLHVDFVTGLLQVLARLDLVERLLSCSRISSLCTIHSSSTSM